MNVLVTVVVIAKDEEEHRHLFRIAGSPRF